MPSAAKSVLYFTTESTPTLLGLDIPDEAAAHATANRHRNVTHRTVGVQRAWATARQMDAIRRAIFEDWEFEVDVVPPPAPGKVPRVTVRTSRTPRSESTSSTGQAKPAVQPPGFAPATWRARQLYEAVRSTQHRWHRLERERDEAISGAMDDASESVVEARCQAARQAFLNARDAYVAHGEATNEWVGLAETVYDSRLTGLPDPELDGDPSDSADWFLALLPPPFGE